MKKQIVRGIVVLMSLLFLALPALSAVSVAPNDKGDLMFFPVYYALEGIETNIAVINTSDTCCAVAKIVVRSHKYSVEVLDFLIYLTPNDVFKATLKYEGGKYILTSTDDSLCVGIDENNMTCASEAAPISLELYDPSYACDCATDDDQSWGYIDLIEATAIRLPKETDGTVKKVDLYTEYLTQYVTDTGTPNEPMTPDNILTGYAELVLPGFGVSIFKPTIMKDYGNTIQLKVGQTDPPLERSNDIEAALSKNSLAISYLNQADAFSIAWLNFPTKRSQCPPDEDCIWTAQGCYFGHAGMAPTYIANLYDMEEHTITTGCLRSPCPEEDIKKLPEEVNVIADWLSSGNPFSEGWARVTIESIDAGDCVTNCNDNVTYVDPPVIGLVAQITADGLALMAPAYDFGAIVGEGTAVNGCWQLGCVPCGDYDGDCADLALGDGAD